jgi:hypothetical protein
MEHAAHNGHNTDCRTTYGPQFRDATMAVTFMDGKTQIYKNVRVCINRLLENGAEDDGIMVNGTTLRFEASDTNFTLLGVRQYTYEIDGHPWDDDRSDEPPF